jgi:Na+/melibiose symporter-like transporter
MPEQPDSAITVIRMCVSVVPFLLAVMAAWLIRFYDLSDVRDDAGHADSP